MTEISLHILDIVHNSLKAGSDHVKIGIGIDQRDFLLIKITDNGKGFDKDFSPLNQSKSIKPGIKNGLGLILFSELCTSCDGMLSAKNGDKGGAEITAKLSLSSPNRPVLGEIGSTYRLLTVCNPHICFGFEYTVYSEGFSLSTADIISRVGRDALSDLSVGEFIEGFISRNISELNGKYDLKGI